MELYSLTNERPPQFLSLAASFINSYAILNRDALWSIQGSELNFEFTDTDPGNQGKNHHVNAAIVRGIRRTGKILR